MTITSMPFLLFFLAVFSVCAISDRAGFFRTKTIFLVLASYFFYAWADYRLCLPLLLVTVSTYLCARNARKTGVFLVGLLVPLGVLAFLRHFGQFMPLLSELFGGRETGWFIVPVGVSFYTFQAIGYLVDVRREKIPAERDFWTLALYFCFFPRLEAGPILQASVFLPQIRAEKRITKEGVLQGIQIFVFGLFKKTVLADRLAVFVGDVFRIPVAYHWLTILWAVFSYSLQIYLDFSGYSDMAAGCAMCLGYELPKNFDLPYSAHSVSEFWRRWHISLSGWIREYIYIPLGGNRQGLVRQCLNLFLTMLLCGIWHGSGWNYLLWGAVNGLALCAERLFPAKTDHVLGKIFRTAGTFLFISFSWIPFRAGDLEEAWRVICSILTFQDGLRQPYLWTAVSALFLAVHAVSAGSRSKKKGVPLSDSAPLMDLETVGGLTWFFVELGMILCLAFTGEHPFVYLKF